MFNTVLAQIRTEEKTTVTHTSQTTESIAIDRSLNVLDFTGKYGKFHVVNEDTDERSLELKEFDPFLVRFMGTRKEREPCLNGEEKLIRLKKSGWIRLDAGILFTLFNTPELIPAHWEKRILNSSKADVIFFDGTVIEDEHGVRRSFYLYKWRGEWNFRYYLLSHTWPYSNNPSAVLAP